MKNRELELKNYRERRYILWKKYKETGKRWNDLYEKSNTNGLKFEEYLKLTGYTMLGLYRKLRLFTFDVKLFAILAMYGEL